MVLNSISQVLLQKENTRKIKVGDTFRVQYVNKLGFWKSRKFSGLCIRVSSKQNSKNFTLRNVISNIPVEIFFYYHSNLVVGFQKLPIKKVKSLKRAKLYYIRNLKLGASRV